MPSTQEPNLGLNYGWTQGESGWASQMDENLRALGALVLVSVGSATTVTPPVSPTAGDRYLIPTGATGAWSGHVGKIARYDGVSWEMYTPKAGWEVRAQDTMQRWHHNGTDWELLLNRIPRYLDDSAAASGGVAIGEMYIGTDGVLRVRIS